MKKHYKARVMKTAKRKNEKKSISIVKAVVGCLLCSKQKINYKHESNSYSEKIVMLIVTY